MDLTTLVKALDAELQSGSYQDGTVNGLQVEGERRSIKRIALAVDAGTSIFKAAEEKGADLLIVHHGLIWGGIDRVTGVPGNRLRSLIKSGMSLYVSHLPLDGHPSLGNAAVIAQKLGLVRRSGFLMDAGKTIGIKGQFQKPKSISSIIASISTITGTKHPFSILTQKKVISTVGIATGGAAFGVWAAAEAKLDLFITGEPKQSVYHDAHELGVSCIFAGHYATEVFGVQALGGWIKKKFGIPSFFIDEPTGI